MLRVYFQKCAIVNYMKTIFAITRQVEIYLEFNFVILEKSLYLYISLHFPLEYLVIDHEQDLCQSY